MNKRLIFTLMSLLLANASFAPILAANYKDEQINWDKIAHHAINTPVEIIKCGAFGFGTAFMPAGTIVFTAGYIYIFLAGNFEKQAQGTSESEKNFIDLKTFLKAGIGIASHLAGWYCFIKIAKQVLEVA